MALEELILVTSKWYVALPIAVAFGCVFGLIKRRHQGSGA